MTREEAIDCLEGLKIYLKTEHIDQEAIDMAIEALQAEPIVRCKECIYYRPADVICEIFNDSTGLSKLVQPDDYCSNGERRD